MAHNFVSWILGRPEDAKSRKVRVNGKFNPKTTEVQAPPEMRSFMKTTVVKYNTGEWFVVERRVPFTDVIQFEHKDNIVLALIFLLEPREWIDAESGRNTGVCFRAVDPCHGQLAGTETDYLADGKRTTMTKRQRSIFKCGVEELQQLDIALNACVQPCNFDDCVTKNHKSLCYVLYHLI